MLDLLMTRGYHTNNMDDFFWRFGLQKNNNNPKSYNIKLYLNDMKKKQKTELFRKMPTWKSI